MRKLQYSYFHISPVGLGLPLARHSRLTEAPLLKNVLQHFSHSSPLFCSIHWSFKDLLALIGGLESIESIKHERVKESNCLKYMQMEFICRTIIWWGHPRYWLISVKKVWNNCCTPISLWSPINSGAKIFVLYTRFRICKNICTLFFGFGCYWLVCLKKVPKT